MLYNKELLTFLKVDEYGSFNKAAQAMFISTPSLVQQIDLLEESLHAKLFHRTHHGVILTNEGEYLKNKAKTIIELCDDVENELNFLGDQIKIVSGRLNEPTYFNKFLYWNDSIDKSQIKYVEIKDLYKDIDNIDVIETLFYPKIQKKLGNFNVLFDTELMIAVPPQSYWAKKDKLSYNDLSNTEIVCIKQGLSQEADKLRKEILLHSYHVKFLDTNYYSFSVIDNAIMNNKLIIAPKCWQTIFKQYLLKKAPFKVKAKYGVYINKRHVKLINDFEKYKKDKFKNLMTN